MTSGQSVPSPCSDLSTNKSLNLTIGYIGNQCWNKLFILFFLVFFSPTVTDIGVWLEVRILQIVPLIILVLGVLVISYQNIYTSDTLSLLLSVVLFICK